MEQEASNKAKTVHSGFFANQGAVETVVPPSTNTSSKSRGASHGAGEGKGSAGGPGSGGNSAGSDGDLIVKKKKKKVRRASQGM